MSFDSTTLLGPVVVVFIVREFREDIGFILIGWDIRYPTHP
jgi:hypothetical protein